MLVKHVVEIIITDMKEGQITGLVFEDTQYVIDTKPVKTEYKEPDEPDFVKRNYLLKKRPRNKVDSWIEENNIVKFNVTEYFNSNPKDLTQKRRIETYISKMVDDKTLTQVSNDTFIVSPKKQ